MGDRYDLNLKCAYCKELNKDVWYAPTCGSDTFICIKCKKRNFITYDFKTKKIEKITIKDVKDGFLENTNTSWTEEQIKRMCKEHLKNIKDEK